MSYHNDTNTRNGRREAAYALVEQLWAESVTIFWKRLEEAASISYQSLDWNRFDTDEAYREFMLPILENKGINVYEDFSDEEPDLEISVPYFLDKEALSKNTTEAQYRLAQAQTDLQIGYTLQKINPAIFDQFFEEEDYSHLFPGQTIRVYYHPDKNASPTSRYYKDFSRHDFFLVMNRLYWRAVYLGQSTQGVLRSTFAHFTNYLVQEALKKQRPVTAHTQLTLRRSLKTQ